MKKTALLILSLIFIFVLSFVGCSAQEALATKPQEQTLEESWRFIDVVANSDPYGIKIVYDSETHIVYYYQNYKYDKKVASSLCPYYSANGCICRYNTETNEIEEVTAQP